MVKIVSSINRFSLLAFFLTCLNAICGVVGILFSLFFYLDSPYWYLPMQLLIFGAIFDYLDGRVAKKAPNPSVLGAYSDSVADVISFAILPGVMVLNSLGEYGIFETQGVFALVIAGFYSLCGWARLIRFATHPTDIHFDGLPSPAAALFVGSSALLATQQETQWIFWTNGLPLTLITILISILMILTVNYPTPKRGKTPDMVAIGIAGVVVLTFVFFPFYGTLGAILFIAILYTTFGPLYLRKTRK